MSAGRFADPGSMGELTADAPSWDAFIDHGVPLRYFPVFEVEFTLQRWRTRMKELQQALSEIHTIRNQVARGSEFRGYGPASIASSGILALLVAALQSQWMPEKPDLNVWLGVWAVTAAVAVLLTGIETFARARRVHVGLAREMVQSAVAQFLPAIAVGFLLTVVMLRAVAHRNVGCCPGSGN